MARRATTRRRARLFWAWLDANVLRHPTWSVVVSGLVLLAVGYYGFHR